MRHFQRPLLFFIILFLFIAIHIVQRGLEPQIKRLKGEFPFKAILPGEFTTLAILTGFRDFAATILWLKVDAFFMTKGRWYRVLPTCRAVVEIKPKFLEAWKFAGWHMAFNMVAEYELMKGLTEETRKKCREWIELGIKALEEAIEKNPDKPEMYFELANTYDRRTEAYAGFGGENNTEDIIKFKAKALEWYKKVAAFKDRTNVVGFPEHLIQRIYERAPEPIKSAEQALYWVERCLRIHGCQLKITKTPDERVWEYYCIAHHDPKDCCTISIRDKTWYTKYMPQVKPKEDEPIEMISKKVKMELETAKIKSEKIEELLYSPEEIEAQRRTKLLAD